VFLPWVKYLKHFGRSQSASFSFFFFLSNAPWFSFWVTASEAMKIQDTCDSLQ